jgi:hypothetical protein
MQAIETKYHGPSYARGSRVTAKCERGRLTVSWDPALNSDGNHRRACRMLLEKFAREDAKRYPGTTAETHHWGDFLSGTLTDGRGVHVLVGRYSGLAMLRRAAIACEPVRLDLTDGKRDSATVDRASIALLALGRALVEVEKEVEA